MGRSIGLRKIVITGPESTGKTTLSESLALKLDADWIPEYARSYVENIGRSYTYEDIEKIAQYQIQAETKMSETTNKRLVIMDTWVIITKVWFEVVYGRSPKWLDEYISTSHVDLFLVCAPDLPWIADPVRENGGEMRNILFERYCEEIKAHGFQYEVVKGVGDQRMHNALNFLKAHHIA